jgi:exodeoxyribonuclease VII large subunit
MVKANLEEAFGSVWIEGEISGYLHHSSGHRYLSLKDDQAVLKVTMWRSAGSRLKFEPENGQKALAHGDITVYEKGGVYQLNCRRLIPAGVGELELAFRQLHERLSEEGLFDQDRKKPLPEYPRRIGIVTSPTGAAIRDIIQIARRRNDTIELVIFPARVQGDGAEQTIVQGIRYFNEHDPVDIIITGRGGGSLEDLWPFNTELAVRAVAGSEIPVVCAVGHEVDTTLTDLVADLRAPTPSAAAELTVWSKPELVERFRAIMGNLADLLETRVADARLQLTGLLGRPVYSRPLDMIRQRQQHLDSTLRLLMATGKNRFELQRNRLSLLASRLDTLSPLRVLARGYSVSRGWPQQRLIASVADVAIGEHIETVLQDGRLKSIIEEIDPTRKPGK